MGIKIKQCLLDFSSGSHPRGDLTAATGHSKPTFRFTVTFREISKDQVVFKREMSAAIITPVTGGEGELIGEHLSKMSLATKSKMIKSTKSHLSKCDQP